MKNNELNIYKKDKYCKKLYKHILHFIHENNVKNNKDCLYVKEILIDIEKIFKKYNF